MVSAFVANIVLATVFHSGHLLGFLNAVSAFFTFVGESSFRDVKAKLLPIFHGISYAVLTLRTLDTTFQVVYAKG